jgi:DNA-binding MarR family transcriptional regulator
VAERFYKLPVDLATRRGLPWPAKGLLAYLADRQGDNGRAWPGMRRIAADLGLSINSIRRAAARAEKAGLLAVERRGQRRSLVYRVTVPTASELNTDSVSGSDTDANQEVYPIRTQAVSESATKVYPNRTRNHTHRTSPRNQTQVTRARRTLAPLPDLPARLDTPDFRAAWDEWQQYRRELRKPLTSATARRQLAELAAAGPETAAAMLRQSIGRGWHSIFPLKDETDGKRGTSHASGRRAAAVPTDEDRAVYARLSGRG